jgi:hypothetical protein
LEKISLEQGQSETISSRRDVAHAPARQSARARRTPPRRPGRALAFPRSSRAPRTPRSPPPPRAARRPPSTRRTAGRSGVPPARHSCRGRRVLLGVRRRSLGHWHARGSPINEVVALPLAHDLPAARLDARRRHGRRAGRAATSGRLRTKTRCSPPSLASTKARRPFTSLSRAALAGTGRSQRPPGLAAGAAPRRPSPYPIQPPESAPWDLGTLPRPCPAGPGRRLAGIWPDRRCLAAKDHIAKRNFFPGSLLQKVNSNSKSDFLILVNYVENHRKM